MLEHKELFDLSDYPKDNKVPEKVKNECISFPVYEGIYLKPKSYSIKSKNSEECKHKEHSYNFKSSNYKYVLHNKQILRHPMKKIVSIDHTLYAQEIDKQSLSCSDDKNYQCADGIKTLAPGHKDIKKLKK